MKDLTISTWKSIKQKADLTVRFAKDPTGNQIYVRLQGKANVVLHLTDQKNESGVHDMRLATTASFMRELSKTNANVERLLDRKIRAYGALQVRVPKLNDQGFVIHVTRCPEESGFRESKRNDWVCVRRHPASDIAESSTLNRRVHGRLDALCKLTSKGLVYRLAYVTLINCVGGTSL